MRKDTGSVLAIRFFASGRCVRNQTTNQDCDQRRRPVEMMWLDHHSVKRKCLPRNGFMALYIGWAASHSFISFRERLSSLHCIGGTDYRLFNSFKRAMVSTYIALHYCHFHCIVMLEYSCFRLQSQMQFPHTQIIPHRYGMMWYNSSVSRSVSSIQISKMQTPQTNTNSFSFVASRSSLRKT